jgi:hypothetical protein
MTNTITAVNVLHDLADERSLKECKECPLLLIKDNKPICMFSDENVHSECKLASKPW